MNNVAVTIMLLSPPQADGWQPDTVELLEHEGAVHLVALDDGEEVGRIVLGQDESGPWMAGDFPDGLFDVDVTGELTTDMATVTIAERAWIMSQRVEQWSLKESIACGLMVTTAMATCTTAPATGIGVFACGSTVIGAMCACEPFIPDDVDGGYCK